VIRSGLLALALSLEAAAVVAAAPRALCRVCAVLEGETRPERSAATSEHAGETLHFCSLACKERFDADPPAFLPPRLPRPAPAFSFTTTLDGAPFEAESLDGKFVLVDFWATWCAPCVAAMPRLARLDREHRERGFEVFGVSIDERKSATELQRFLRERGASYRSALDGGADPLWRRFHVPAVPSLFLLDPHGQVVEQWVAAAVDHRAIEAAVARRLPPPPNR
jgi:thiol-disulfide isomerase/thioredoxin